MERDFFRFQRLSSRRTLIALRSNLLGSEKDNCNYPISNTFQNIKSLTDGVSKCLEILEENKVRCTRMARVSLYFLLQLQFKSLKK